MGIDDVDGDSVSPEEEENAILEVNENRIQVIGRVDLIGDLLKGLPIDQLGL